VIFSTGLLKSGYRGYIVPRAGPRGPESDKQELPLLVIVKLAEFVSTLSLNPMKNFF